jgi:AraC-like DNA-binding protein
MQHFTDSQHIYVDARLRRLEQVLKEECPYVDREALGHWCGFNRPWWVENAGLTQEDYLRLLRQLHTNEVPNIALRVASRTQLQDSGIVGYAMMSSATLDNGLRIAGHLLERSFPYIHIGLETDSEHARLVCQVTAAGSNYFQLLVEEWLIAMWGYIRALLPEGVAACASYATLNYGKPTYHGQYQQLLGCRVSFDQPRAILAIPRQWLYIGVQGSSPQAQTLYDLQIRRLMRDHEHSGDIVSRVKRLLLERPVECGYSLEKTAPLLSLSARTLRRHLADAGTSFRQVCLDVRMDLARDYLLSSSMTVQEIAYQLGYSQPNNFYRAFKAVYGEPPEQYRQGMNH